MAHTVSRIQKMIRKLSRTVFVIGLGLVIVLSLLPQEIVAPETSWDKVHHAAAYAALAFAGGLDFHGRRALLGMGVGLLVLGGGLEIAQAAVPGRVPSANDVVANLIGIIIGSLLAAGVRALQAKRLRGAG